MSELISGKEALIALANGDEVECSNSITGMDWCDATGLLVKSFFDATHMWEFRLKPRIITINGIEVPRNSKRHDKEDVVWLINTSCENWYDWIYGSDCDSSTLYWKTEQEVEQVVEALRSVFK